VAGYSYWLILIAVQFALLGVRESERLIRRFVLCVCCVWLWAAGCGRSAPAVAAALRRPLLAALCARRDHPLIRMIRRARQHAAPPFLPSMWRAGSWGISPVITRWHSQQRSGFASRAQQQKQALLARRRRQRQQAAGAGAGDHRAKGGVAAPRAAALQKKPWEDFAPTQEWQTVEEHHILPPGLEIRVDMSSGSKVARLLPAAPVEVDSTVDELKRADAIVYESYAAAAGAGGGGSGGDRTVQKFTGRDAWKNWVDWDSPHTEQTDELNRRRHFFYHVDSKGRLLRRELGADPPRWPQGQIRDSGFLEYVASHASISALNCLIRLPFRDCHWRFRCTAAWLTCVAYWVGTFSLTCS
jgi:hypothetical protein